MPTIVGLLANPDPNVRAAAAESLGKIGDTEATPKVRTAPRKDDSLDVRKAAIAGRRRGLKDRESIPAADPRRRAESEPTRYEATIALASMPDIRALQIHLKGLSDKSPDVRKAASSALLAIRDEARPALERLSGRKELPPSALPELRKIYGAIRPIADWKVIGPFKMNERPPFATNRPVDTTKPLTYEGKPLAWTSARAKDAEGQVDLNDVYSHGERKSAFAYAELSSPSARPARMAVGSDDTLQVWLNGKSVFKHDGDRGFTAGEDEFDVNLVKGTNRIVLRCGNTGGPWAFSVGVSTDEGYAFLKGPTTGGFDPDRFRSQALQGQGKAERGKALFHDLKGVACLKCHAVGGQGGTVGPELSAVGLKYPREELITSVLYPSQRISSGYEPVVLATADGRVVTGILKSETPEAIEIEDADGGESRCTRPVSRRPQVERRLADAQRPGRGAHADRLRRPDRLPGDPEGHLRPPRPRRGGRGEAERPGRLMTRGLATIPLVVGQRTLAPDPTGASLVPTTPARRLSIADAMIACAAVAAWFAIVRASVPVAGFPTRLAVPFGAEAVVVAALGTATAALLVMRLRPPRLPIRRLVFRPGFAAASSPRPSHAAVGTCRSYGVFGEGWSPVGLLTAFTHCPAFAVGGAWMVLVLGGVWRVAPRDWLDRAGQAAGVTWVVSPVAYWLAMFVILYYL